MDCMGTLKLGYFPHVLSFPISVPSLTSDTLTLLKPKKPKTPNFAPHFQLVSLIALMK